MKSRILLVEDEIKILDFAKEILMSNNYDVDTAVDGEEAYNLFKERNYDLVISDVMIPKVDGFQLVKLIRQKDEKIPIILLTALSDEENEVKGFDMGVSDYISKPFSFKVLVKRVEAQIKDVKTAHVLELANIKMNLDSRVVTVDNKEINLTLKQFEILKYFMENPNFVITREQIMNQVWGYGYYGDLRNIDTHVKNLRQKLLINNIKTVKGVGYNFVI